MALKIFRVIALILVIVLLGVVGANLFIHNSDNSNRAIVVIHGTMGGGLMLTDGTPVWDPFGGELSYFDFFKDPIAMVFDILFGQYASRSSDVINSVLANDPNGLLYMMISDEDGRVKNNGIVPGTPDSAVPFGPFNAYRGIYEGINNEFGDKIEVAMFQYDWRQDNRISGQRLEEFINQNGWDEVILVAHSMGNIVTSSYLARGEENRAKVRGYMALAGPFLGATTALTVLEDPGIYINGVVDMINNTPMLKNLLGNKVDTIINDQILPLIYNMASTAQLLPTIEYARALKEYYGEAFLTVDGREITTNEELVAYYLSRPWAKKTNGNLRAFMADLGEFMDSFYVEEGGARKHVSELVNTWYFAGTGKTTDLGAAIKNNRLDKVVQGPKGDGTVPLYSATLGKHPDGNARIKVYDNHGHVDVGMEYTGEFARDLGTVIRYLL
jgi:pimeloyl-ACP methyl ester carboxylesterase